MKKRIIVFFTMFVLLFALAACGGNKESDFVGKWEATKMVSDGQEYKMKDFGLSMTLELKDGGKAVMSMGGDKEEGTWEVKDGKLILNDGSEEGTPGELKGGALIMKQEGVEIHFEKK